MMLTTKLTFEAATKVGLVKNSVSIVIGGTSKINVKNAPKGAKITYKSAKKSIVTVSKSGEVKGIKSGIANIVVSVKKNSKTTKLIYKVTVKSPKLSKGKLSLKAGKIGNLSVKNKPRNAKYTWTSSNTRVATVNKNGKVMAKTKGTATMKVKVKTAAKTYNLSCKLTVKSTSEDFEDVKQTYIVSFNSNGGSAVASQVVEKNGKATQPVNPTKDGYTFDGWYTLASGGQKFDFNTAITENVILYAHWSAINAYIDTYTVTFNSNGGSAVAPQAVRKNGKATQPVNPTKDGYTFDGWYTLANGGQKFDFNTAITENVILYAHWSNIDTYTVTFDSNGGSAVESQIVKAGEHAVKPEDPKKGSYVFDGWYTSNDYSQEFFFLDTSISKDIVLFAKWVYNTDTVEQYSYEIIPLMVPFNSYFYIKTDNPDPDSFRFIDEVTKYADTGKKGDITPVDTVFADVQYENPETKRVKGGYIAKGSETDGGVLKLQAGKATGTRHQYYDTTITVQIAELMEVEDYLIATYGDSSMSYFDNLSRIEDGFSKECLYSGVYVLGEQKKSTSAPYYGLSTSPHVDQTFYIQDPYYRTDNKSMLVSAIYPMRYDSLGFPSMMKIIAQKLDSSATVKWSSSAHYLIDVTFNGETRSYGGQGSGGGQGIHADQIKYWYSFDESSGDAYLKCNLKDVSAMINEYGKMDVPEEPKDLPELTWSSVRQTVGKEGSYVKLVLVTSVFGGSGVGYTFMYDDGRTDEGLQAWGAIGYFSNAWYDGRYFNKWEYFYPGAKFEKTVEDVSPSIILKDASIKLPNDGRTYYYDYHTLDEAGIYNEETGVWSGFMIYRYDKDSRTWKNDLLNRVKYKDNGSYKEMDDSNFIDACTITFDEALEMNLDANTNLDPTSYYIYDTVTEPGTYHSGGN